MSIAQSLNIAEHVLNAETVLDLPHFSLIQVNHFRLY